MLIFLILSSNVPTLGGFEGSKNFDRVRKELSAIPIRIIDEELGLTLADRWDLTWVMGRPRFEDLSSVIALRN
jgi:hypothetical protein